jgi:hypothetical protein
LAIASSIVDCADSNATGSFLKTNLPERA